MGCVSSSPSEPKSASQGAPPARKQSEESNVQTPKSSVTANSNARKDGVQGSAGAPNAVSQTRQQAQSATLPQPQQQSPSAQPLYAQPIPRQNDNHAANRDRSDRGERPREDDEESDWDRCSTTQLDLEGEAQKTCPANEGLAGASVVQKVANTSLFAESTNACKETTTLRIDKVKGCMFVNQYLVVKFLGRGACGKVFLCLNTHDMRLYAMKAVRKVDLESAQGASQNANAKKRNPMDDLKREIMIMKKMKHPNVVVLSEVIDDPAGNKLLLVMEFMEGGPVLTRDALEKQEKLPESLALHYFRDMLKALDYLHCNKVVHGDLKPENVLMGTSGDVKLSDFGCSKVFATGNEYLERCNGTPAFLAPEMMKPNTRYRGRPTDVYALGACLYTLIFGRIPFSAPNLYKLFQVVQTEPVKYPKDIVFSDELRDLIDAMLKKNPEERISIQDLLRHPWVTMNGRFPLKSSRELKEGETQEQHSLLQDGKTFGEMNPRGDYLSDLANFCQHERRFNEGDVIIRQGDTGTYMMYIVSGIVDVVVRMSTNPKRSASQSTAGQSGRMKSQGTQDEFMDESDSMSPITDPESRSHRVKLQRSSQTACEFVRTLEESAAQRGPNSPSLTSREMLVAQRGSGELVGEMALFSKSLVRCASVRCATKVNARIITHEQLLDYVLLHPPAKHQIREGIWQKESEITMVEALVKLANASEIIAASLEAKPGGSLPGGPASHSQGLSHPVPHMPPVGPAHPNAMMHGGMSAQGMMQVPGGMASPGAKQGMPPGQMQQHQLQQLQVRQPGSPYAMQGQSPHGVQQQGSQPGSS